MTFDVEEFMTDLGRGLIVDAPQQVQDMIYATDGLSVAILSFVDDAKKGLAATAAREHGALEKLELALRARKTAVVAAAPAHNFTVEKLVGKALDRIMIKARELAGA